MRPSLGVSYLLLVILVNSFFGALGFAQGQSISGDLPASVTAGTIYTVNITGSAGDIVNISKSDKTGLLSTSGPIVLDGSGKGSFTVQFATIERSQLRLLILRQRFCIHWKYNCRHYTPCRRPSRQRVSRYRLHGKCNWPSR